MMTNVVICGIGGQGNILASGLMGSALVEIFLFMQEGKADVVVAFEPVEALRILRVYGNPNTKVIYDTRPAYPLGVLIGEDEYPSIEDIDAEINARSSVSYPLPATEMAVEAGNAKVANIIMMGALAAMDEIPLEPEEFYKVLEQNFHGGALELNKEVFMTGYRFIKEGGAK